VSASKYEPRSAHPTLQCACPTISPHMTTPIQSLARTLKLLRTELAETRNRPEHSKGAHSSVGGAVGATASQRKSAVLRLPGKLKALRSTEGQLPQGEVLRTFVEAALLDEFGDEHQLDPSFAELVEKTCKAIESDPRSAALMQVAMGELLSMLEP